VPLAAGNFLYIAASDLIPEVKAHADLKANIVHFAAFAAGVVLMLVVKLALES
jgi:zinc and cadmium transporter